MSDKPIDSNALCSQCDVWCQFALPRVGDSTVSGVVCAPVTDEDWERTRNLMRATVRLLESKNI